MCGRREFGIALETGSLAGLRKILVRNCAYSPPRRAGAGCQASIRAGGEAPLGAALASILPPPSASPISPSLLDIGNFDGAGGGSLRRNNCCLFYRSAHGGYRRIDEADRARSGSARAVARP